MTKRSTGRPTRLNYELMEMLTDALKSKASVSEACIYAGISRDSYYRYLNRNSVFAHRMSEAQKNKVDF